MLLDLRKAFDIMEIDFLHSLHTASSNKYVPYTMFPSIKRRDECKALQNVSHYLETVSALESVLDGSTNNLDQFVEDVGISQLTAMYHNLTIDASNLTSCLTEYKILLDRLDANQLETVAYLHSTNVTNAGM